MCVFVISYLKGVLRRRREELPSLSDDSPDCLVHLLASSQVVVVWGVTGVSLDGAQAVEDFRAGLFGQFGQEEFSIHVQRSRLLQLRMVAARHIEASNHFNRDNRIFLDFVRETGVACSQKAPRKFDSFMNLLAAVA